MWHSQEVYAKQSLSLLISHFCSKQSQMESIHFTTKMVAFVRVAYMLYVWCFAIEWYGKGIVCLACFGAFLTNALSQNQIFMQSSDFLMAAPVLWYLTRVLWNLINVCKAFWFLDERHNRSSLTLLTSAFIFSLVTDQSPRH